MIKYYVINIDETAKPVGNSQEGFSIFNQYQESFKTLQEAKDYLKEKYQGHKKQKMFCDDKEGNAKQIGWIYSFKNSDISHDSKPWYQQDWVSITERQDININI